MLCGKTILVASKKFRLVLANLLDRKSRYHTSSVSVTHARYMQYSGDGFARLKACGLDVHDVHELLAGPKKWF